MSSTQTIQPNERMKKLSSQKPPQVTVAVVTYNGINVIKNCLDSLQSQTYKPAQILVIDNASTDNTPDWVEEHYSQIKVIRLNSNCGPNPARNQGILNTPDNDLTLLVDDDAILAENCLNELVKAYQRYPEAAILAPRLVYNDQRDTIQHEGAFIHYTAEAVLLNNDKPLNQGSKDITQVHAVSGTCLLVSKSAAKKIGLFDEDYFFGRTDGEFSFRLTISGYKVYTVPDAVCYHRVKKRGLSKLFYQVRNRWYFILTTYSLKTLIVLAPALLVYELFLIAYLLMQGKELEYIKAIFAVIKFWDKLMQKRKKAQNIKTRSDRELLRSDSLYMRDDLLKNSILASVKSGLDKFFRTYWKLIYPLI
ncbi:glycosyltransferase family 2 protein [Capilliphycus salinus ALCB114379]|uniref:glycosyltransferase family 2 protein n=1 Tax=Capilliphycus salinus TaxID=2768948 RepID=UPI0039A4E46F